MRPDGAFVWPVSTETFCTAANETASGASEPPIASRLAGIPGGPR